MLGGHVRRKRCSRLLCVCRMKGDIEISLLVRLSGRRTPQSGKRWKLKRTGLLFVEGELLPVLLLQLLQLGVDALLLLAG